MDPHYRVLTKGPLVSIQGVLTMVDMTIAVPGVARKLDGSTGDDARASTENYGL